MVDARMPPPCSRLERLRNFLAEDPCNLQLLADAAEAAHGDDELGEAAALIDRYETIAPAPPALLNLKSLIALREGRFKAAALMLEDLHSGPADDPAIRFNLAWCKAMMRDFEGALALLDDAVVDETPRGGVLRMKMLHHLGRLTEALAEGAALAPRRPGDRDLMGALSAIAMDDVQAALAEAYAARAVDNDDGLATLGMLALGEEQVDRATGLFERALEINPNNARGWLGKGLSLLIAGQAPTAAACIDRSAGLFAGHVGTWVAAGWAHFMTGDYALSRERFERALSLDDRFAETQGALAVLDMAQGHMDNAKRRTQVALRLDRNCLAGALAKSLILASEGRGDAAEKVRAIAMNVPLGQSGKTIAQALVGFSVKRSTGFDA